MSIPPEDRRGLSFHVQVSRSFHRASVFNLSEAQMRSQVLQPWSRGEPVELGEREWDPAESDVVVLEGPPLDPSELSLGQGWHAASKKGRDVTARLLAESSERAPAGGAVAVLGESAAAREAMESLLAELGLQTADWGEVRSRLLASAETVVTAAVVVLGPGQSDEPARWAFEIGLAVGALRGRVILAAVGTGSVPAGLGDLGAIRLDPGSRAPLHDLVERLRLIGCDARPAPGWDEPSRFGFATPSGHSATRTEP